MSISAYFASLGAPLRNIRWSWGAVHPNGDVYLRVWEDEFRTVHGQRCARLTNREFYRQYGRRHPGNEERLEHIRLIRNGAPSFCIVCRMANPNAKSRTIRSFNRTLVRGVRLHLFMDDDWLEVV